MNYINTLHKNTIYELPKSIIDSLIWKHYIPEVAKKYKTKKQLTNIDIVDINIALQPINPLKIVKQLEFVLELTYKEYISLCIEYIQAKEIIPTLKNKIRDQYYLEVQNNIAVLNGLVTSLADLSEQIITNSRHHDINKIVAKAQYYAIQSLLHIIKLREQTTNNTITKIATIKQLQSGKKDGTNSRNKKKEPYLKTVDGVIKFINDNFANWYQSWKKYHNSTGKKPPKYTDIPKHFKSWFKKLDTETTATKTKGVNYYWDSHKKTTENPFISNFLRKYQD